MPTYVVSDITHLKFDKIVIVNGGNYGTLHDELIYGYGIDEKKVTSANYLIRHRIICENVDNVDGEIKQTICNLLNQDDFDIWCGYNQEPRKIYEVTWDQEVYMPYVIFADKRVFYPRDKRFGVIDGKQVVSGLEFEQQPGSPHSYLTDKHRIMEGDVLVDAGVCEGNFAIRFVDVCSKIYLIECNPAWRYPLMLTFRDYWDKVVYVDKFLGAKDDEKTITLDTLIGNEKCDFIKMDIEGAEKDALRGGMNTFLKNDIRCSVCCYHRHGDESVIKSILNDYGYETTTSKGHMVFPYEGQRFKWHELRHGIVYGRKDGTASY